MNVILFLLFICSSYQQFLLQPEFIPIISSINYGDYQHFVFAQDRNSRIILTNDISGRTCIYASYNNTDVNATNSWKQATNLGEKRIVTFGAPQGEIFVGVLGFDRNQQSDYKIEIMNQDQYSCLPSKKIPPGKISPKQFPTKWGRDSRTIPYKGYYSYILELCTSYYSLLNMTTFTQPEDEIIFYVAINYMPTPEQFDYKRETDSKGRTELIITSPNGHLQMGSYYINIFGKSIDGPTYTILAEGY